MPNVIPVISRNAYTLSGDTTRWELLKEHIKGKTFSHIIKANDHLTLGMVTCTAYVALYTMTHSHIAHAKNG